ncbi:unnamed protein product [Amoebophrya sp. A25]|nr:unnamed protein product [Amoebophrya sp. A25]|eukprot:GSA25T00015777001.1
MASTSGSSPRNSGRKSDVSRPASSLSPYLYIPNVIDYGRLLLLFVSFHYAYTDYARAAFFFASSAFLDAFDGMAARHFNQTSEMGAVLDMVIDRCSTNVFLAVLAHLYVDYAMVFFSLMVLDVVSHWIHMYASLRTGQTSHKDMSNSNCLIRLYYKNKAVLFTVCLAEQIVYCALYVMYFTAENSNYIASRSAAASGEALAFQVCTAAFLIALPLHIFKQATNFLQMYQAFEALNAWDLTKERAAGGSTPGSARNRSSPRSSSRTKAA